jgi:CheY-like chemotaxis protein
LGNGSTFIVSLPLTMPLPQELSEPEPRRPSAIAGTAPANVPATMLKGIKVLVVDDEPDARALVKRLLEDCEATVLTASSAAEAMEYLRNEPPSVLVSDIGMPDEDGYALIRKVRALDKQRGINTPALALTAYARSEDRMQAIRNGYQMHTSPNPSSPRSWPPSWPHWPGGRGSPPICRTTRRIRRLQFKSIANQEDR